MSVTLRMDFVFEPPTAASGRRLKAVKNSPRSPAKATQPEPIMHSLKTSTNPLASNTAIAELARILIPADLRKWMDAPTLAGLVRTALATITPEMRTGDTRRPASQGRSPKTLLAVLTYSYAAGILMSEAIAEEIQTDIVLQEWCGDGSLEEAELRQFRRANRPQVRECLAQVLERAWGERRDLGGGVPFGLGQSLSADQGFICPANQRLTPAVVFALEAEQRLSYAIQLNSMALDF